MGTSRSPVDTTVAFWFGVGPSSVAVALLLVGLGGLGGIALHVVRTRRQARAARPVDPLATPRRAEPGRVIIQSVRGRPGTGGMGSTRG